MGAVVEWLDRGDLDAHVVVRAAMAHLHFVSVHPFRDGNGRVSRIVQSLVLAREGLLAPEFVSIEEYLGRSTGTYYATLQKVQGGTYRPERDAAAWVRLCVQAHVEQARLRLEQVAEAGTRWSFLEELVERRDWPDRLVIALEQSLFQGVDRASYATEADVSAPTASNDFRRLSTRRSSFSAAKAAPHATSPARACAATFAAASARDVADRARSGEARETGFEFLSGASVGSQHGVARR
jgi:Fic family protein